MSLVCIDEIDIKEKRVLIRVDFNVPLTREGDIKDDSRILAAIPTIEHAVREKARVIIASHLGRPGGKVNPKLSLEMVGRRLSDILNMEVFFPEDCIGDAVKKLAGDMHPGSVMLLENLRFHKGEEENNPTFSKKLASIADIYVNDAFSVSHRSHASTAGILEHVENAYIGLAFRKELEHLSRLINDAPRPFVAIFGGRNASEKMPVMESLIEKVDSFLVGGATANTFLKTLGKEIGRSAVEDMSLYTASKVISSAAARNIRLGVPDDVTAIKGDLNNYSSSFIIPSSLIPKNAVVVDIGPKTVEYFSLIISRAKTVLWNGPLGIIETDEFRKGTQEVAAAISNSGAFSVAAGWDTVTALNEAGLGRKVTHLSMGGKAALEFIQGNNLPVLEALRKKVG